MDPSSTFNESKTPEMSSNMVNYNELEMMSEEIDQDRINTFQTDVNIEQGWTLKGRLTTVQDKDDRTQYQINSSRTRLSYSTMPLL